MKKAIALLLVIALTAAVAIGGTLAFLTDRENETNVFTMGDVKIKLDNQFAQGIELAPGVAVDNTITITNTGDNDAWIWYTVQFKNYADVISVTGIDSTVWTQSAEGAQLLNTYLPVGDSVTVNMQIKLADYVDIDENGNMVKIVDGVVTDLGYNISAGNPVAYIDAYAIQRDNFATVEAAFAAYKTQWGANWNENDTVAPKVAQAATAEELATALAANDVVVLTADVDLMDAPIVVSSNKTINLNGKTLQGYSTSSTSSNLLKVNKGATLTLTNGTVSFEAGNPDTDWGVNNPSRPFPGYANNTLSVSGTLIIDGATIENKTAKGGASYAIDCYPGANLIINKGEIKGYDKVAIRTFANSATEAISVTVNGGEISGSRAVWIQLPGSNASVAPMVNLTVNGGTLKTTDAAGYNLAIYSYSFGNSADGVKVALNGGTIVGDVAVGASAGTTVGKETVTLSDNCTIYGRVFRYTSGAEEEIKVGGTTAATQTDLDAAVASGKDIYLAAGNYKLPNTGVNKEFTITGDKNAVVDLTMGAYMEGAKVSITGVTIKTGTGKANGNGSDYAALYTPNVTYTDCTFVGPMRVGRDGATFVNCRFTELGNDYIWTYGNDCTFIGCTFETEGKAILIYSDGGTEVSKVVVKDCVFNATQGAKAGAIANQNCAAIEIHNYGNGVELTTSGNTMDSDFSGEWRIKTYENGRTKVVVNGVEYTTIALDGKLMTIDANKNVTIQ